MAAVENIIRVDIYTRESCEQTSPVRQVLSEVGDRFPLEINVFDIGHDIALEIAYGKDVPVVLIDGTERFRGHINEHELKIILQTINMKRNQERRRQRSG